MKLKGFKKLTIQIAILSISMIALSFLTKTEIWQDYFNYTCSPDEDIKHYMIFGASHSYPKSHWNYRGWVYFLTGLIYFVLSVIKILMSNKESDFKNYS